ncbi:hypothetical protein HI806_02260 [Ralstonia solanacearum]|uniref:hypothetical protein n=1 Tax=Ralstonia pseudosolanacearum TaxID=1310165 RepID=UPI000903047E|nr:hypothetical protein [Ralstonia pseudosolanacearum]APF85676.1 hypothetical protein BCR16_02120 [Ralstonia solanacearum FJAT-1458]AZU57886.1 hypothetical protein CFM90_17840 [Ralstonia solanacearum]QKL70181.1 hypothetical protein HI806_02260 [Ralstonia solanacearum]QKL75394.1 hypothetical protein HI805_02265 [Ralstonia solanacearum]QKL80595.1 hypothetical protein HI804_02270 [Ralstonia solanacearum]
MTTAQAFVLAVTLAAMVASVGVFCVWLTRTAASIEQCETKHGCRHMLCVAAVPFVVAFAALCLFRGVL